MALISKERLNGTLGSHSIRLLCLTVVLKLGTYFFTRRGRSRRRRSSSDVQLNWKLMQHLGSLLKICVPGVLTVELGGVLLLSALLLLQTKLTLVCAMTSGQLGRLLVERKIQKFFFGVADIALLSIPGAAINVTVDYSRSMLQQRFMDNLQNALQQEYLEGNTAYVVATQNALDNPDHRIVQDTKLFCSELTDLFKSVLKPLLDVVTLTLALSKTGGFGSPGLLFSYYALVGALMSTTHPNFASLVAISQEKEGNLRTTHNQLVQHAEEVAFYGGEELEREHADRLLKSITGHEKVIRQAKWWSGLMDSLLIKYGSVCIGYIVCGAVALDQKDRLTKPELTQLYLQSSQLYMPLSFAIGKLLLLHKKIGAVLGSAHRVGELCETISQISANSRRISPNITFKGHELVSFSHVNIISPNGCVLIKDFSVEIRRGEHVLIMGSNGSGKSALVRVLSELWPLEKGYIQKPVSNIFFLPQRVYLPLGTLRAQMVYPYTEEEAAQNNITDGIIMKYVASLGLSQVVEREGGLEAIRNWHEVLSGGERQRVALVRIFTHAPVFAVLDECTSAVSQDDEPQLYTQLQDAGVTLISISHRKALKMIHDVLIELDGQGGYYVTNLSK